MANTREKKVATGTNIPKHFPPTTIEEIFDIPKHFASSVYDQAQGKILEYHHLLQHINDKTHNQRKRAGSNEFGRLIEEVGKTRKARDYIKGTNSMRFIPKHQVPQKKL